MSAPSSAWEDYMPLLRAAMCVKGVEIYCAPTADGRDTWLPRVQHIAQESRCFVLSLQPVRAPAQLPDGVATEFGDDPDTVLSRGRS